MNNIHLKPAPDFEYYKQELYWNNFDQIADMMSEAVSGSPSVSWVNHVRQLYGPRESGLFISCGNGWVERDCYRAGLIRRAIGFDVLPNLVEQARAEAIKIGMPSRYLLADGNALIAPDLGCDLIVNHGAMHHIAYIDRLTRRLAGLLKPGGIYVVRDYTGPHRNQYSWEAVSRTLEVNQSLPLEYRVTPGYAHIPTMLALDPTEAVHSELQMQVLHRYFDVVSEVSYGGAIAYTLLFGNHALHLDQHTERGAHWIRHILEADRAFLRQMPSSNLFTFAICTPKASPGNSVPLDQWQSEEEEREKNSQLNGGRYYPPTSLELLYQTVDDRLPAPTLPQHDLVKQPRLSIDNAQTSARPCKLCGGSAPFFDVVDFNKCASVANYYGFGSSGVTVPYHRCMDCGFLFTAFCDDWTPSDFRDFIYNDDYILVDPDYTGARARDQAAGVRGLLSGFERERILDYGAGSGHFAEAMATFGFAAVESYDPFSQPRRPEGRFAVITCFEVIEHSPDPCSTLADMRDLLADDGCIIISQSLQPTDIEQIRANWWYCAPRNGHVSTFTDRALATLAERCGLVFHRHSSSTHVLRRSCEGRAAILARRIAPEFWAATLGAPPGGNKEAWHSIEDYGRGAFRWTAQKTFSWPLEVPQGGPWLVQIRLPYEIEVRPGLAQECRMSIGGIAASLEIRERSIFAEATGVAAGSVTVDLELPELLRPGDLRSSPDMRRLGLAVRVPGPAE